MQWVEAILDETPAVAAATTRSDLPGVDAAAIDVPLASTASTVGVLRLLLHPAGQVAISGAALNDLAQKIGAAAGLGTSLADLRREEHERTALYGVAIQLTGRAELRELLDLITKHARELLGAERAVACLADPRHDSHGL